MSIEEPPQLGYVSGADAETVHSSGVVWHRGVNTDATSCDEFEYGAGTLQPGAAASVVPETRFEETDCEAAALVTGGEATVTVDGETHRLTAYDCLFIPPNGEYSFENRSGAPVEFLWGIAGSTDPDDRIDIDPVEHGGTPQIVHTLRDLDASVTLEPGHSSRLWTAVFPETVGSTDLTMGVIKRPPGSVAPLHGHDPTTLTEAFTVLDGRLLITDQTGRETVLGPDAFMYIPERGMHRNKSIHMDGTTYAFIENPARGRDYPPFDMADSASK